MIYHCHDSSHSNHLGPWSDSCDLSHLHRTFGLITCSAQSQDTYMIEWIERINWLSGFTWCKWCTWSTRLESFTSRMKYLDRLLAFHDSNGLSDSSDLNHSGHWSDRDDSILRPRRSSNPTQAMYKVGDLIPPPSPLPTQCRQQRVC